MKAIARESGMDGPAEIRLGRSVVPSGFFPDFFAVRRLGEAVSVRSRDGRSVSVGGSGWLRGRAVSTRPCGLVGLWTLGERRDSSASSATCATTHVR